MARISLKTLPDPYAVEVTARNHTWIVDEPVETGGGDQGPGTFEELLSSIGTCGAITMCMYARRKEWPLEGVEIELEYERLKTSGSGRVSEIRSRIRLKGDLSEEQRSRLVEISQRCPVKRAVEGEVRFQAELAD
jgi:putative redox protein